MERRKHRRTDISVTIRIEIGDRGWPAFARDISSRGVFLDLDCMALDNAQYQVELHFEIDTGMQVLSRRIRGEVTRRDTAGLAVRFSEHDILARAVVHELMYYLRLRQNRDQAQADPEPREGVA